MLVVVQVVPAPYRMDSTPQAPALGIESDPAVPEPVQRIVHRSCMDCHSTGTKLPWYGHIAPVSWMLARDVSRARSVMDLSHWSAQPLPVRSSLAMLICQDARAGRMPPASYQFMHPEARLRLQEVETLCSWSRHMMEQARLRRQR